MNPIWLSSLVEKRLPFAPISPQTVRSAVKGGISSGSIENVGQGALVPVCATNLD
jgi:hypothetical protein